MKSFWKTFWHLWGVLEGLLAPGDPPEPPRTLLGASWTASWILLEPILDPTWIKCEPPRSQLGANWSQPLSGDVCISRLHCGFLMGGAAFQTHPEGFVKLHVTSCWGYVGFSWAQVPSKVAPDWFMLPQVGPKGSQKTSKHAEMSPK